MANLVVSEFVTMDGVFEDPGGAEQFERGGWAFRFDRGPEGDKFKVDEVMAAEAQLLGRVTYEGFAEAWPGRSDEAGFADKMNSMPKYVVSTTLEHADWTNSTVISGNVADEVRRIKSELSGDILVAGSGMLVQTLIDHDLVDEFRLMVFPVVLGSGRRLFAANSATATMKLVECKPAAECAILVYRAARG
jgi:dihydrofolate reductase